MTLDEFREGTKSADGSLEIFVWDLDYIDWQATGGVRVISERTAERDAGVYIE